MLRSIACAMLAIAWGCALPDANAPGPSESTTVAAATSSPPCGYLRGDRLRWWTAAVPPSEVFRASDTLDCWFNDAIRLEEQFNGAPNSLANLGLHGVAIRAIDGADALTDATRHTANIPRVAQRRFTSDEQLYQRPAALDFTLGQRAVVVELGLLFDEGYRPKSSTGANGVDASAVRMVAYDRNADPIGETTLADFLGRGATADNTRVDYLIGLSDQQARIMHVEIFLDDENSDTAATVAERRPIRATLMLHRIVHETLPPAAVLQSELAVPTGTTKGDVTIQLPFELDSAQVLLRGWRFDGNNKADGVSMLTMSITNRAVVTDPVTHAHSVRLDAEALADLGYQAPEAKVYYSLLAWDSRQIQVFTKNQTLLVQGTGTATATARVMTPCSAAACNQGGVVISAGEHFAWFDSSEWDMWTLFHDAQPQFPNVAQQMDLSATFDADDYQQRTFLYDEHAVAMLGGSVVADPHPNKPLLPNWALPETTIRPPGSPNWDWWEFATDAQGLSGHVDATIAAVGLNNVFVDATGRQATEPNGPRHVRAMDVEVKGQDYDGHTVKLLIGGGGVSTVDKGQTELAKTYMLTPVYVGLKPLDSSGVLTAGTLVCTSYVPGATINCSGSVQNTGTGIATIYDLTVDGDTAPYSNWQASAHSVTTTFAGVRAHPVALMPTERMDILVQYKGPVVGDNLATLHVANSGMPSVLDVPVHGYVEPAGLWVPSRVYLGDVVLGQNATRHALFENVGTPALVIRGLAITGDLEHNFNVSPSAPGSLAPGDVYLPTITFAPTRISSSVPQYGGEDKHATVTVNTTVGNFSLEVSGVALRPPSPAADVTPTTLPYGANLAGTRVTRSIIVRSSGSANLVINSLSIAGSRYRLVAPPATPLSLPAGAEQRIDVEYTAGNVVGASETGLVTIATNAGTYGIPTSATVAQ